MTRPFLALAVMVQSRVLNLLPRWSWTELMTTRCPASDNRSKKPAEPPGTVILQLIELLTKHIKLHLLIHFAARKMVSNHRSEQDDQRRLVLLPCSYHRICLQPGSSPLTMYLCRSTSTT
ncbi:hypothetical protein OIU76_017314 [Salix suchowensis]|nr:hypothetical protein OIU76_017314 [Salix suchowensis]